MEFNQKKAYFRVLPVFTYPLYSTVLPSKTHKCQVFTKLTLFLYFFNLSKQIMYLKIKKNKYKLTKIHENMKKSKNRTQKVTTGSYLYLPQNPQNRPKWQK